MERWLITGASGRLGASAVASLRSPSQAGHARPVEIDQILALSGTQRVTVAGVETRPCLLNDRVQLQDHVEQFTPTHVLHFGAVTSVDEAAKNPDLARAINVDATCLLAQAARKVGAQFVFASTDMVFDGSTAPYREGDPTSPLSEYGRSKVAAEERLAEFDQVAVVRVALMVGDSPPPSGVGFRQFRQQLADGVRYRLFFDEFRTPLCYEDAAWAFISVARARHHGLLHLGGPERVSRLELGRRLAHALAVAEPSFEAVSRTDVTSPEPRPADISLDSARFVSLYPQAVPRTIELACASSRWSG